MAVKVYEDEQISNISFRKKLAGVIISKNNPLRAAFIFGFASLSSWMPVFNLWLEDAGLKGSQIGYVAAIPWIIMLFLQPVWGILADKYGKILCLKLSIFAAGAFFLLLPWLGAGVLFIALLTVMVSIFNTPVLPLLDSIALDRVEQDPGISYSNIRFWGAPGYALGAVVTGWLIPGFGVSVAFFMSSFFLLLVFFSIRLFDYGKSHSRSMDIEFTDLKSVLRGKVLTGFLIVIVIVSVVQTAIFFYLTLYMRQIGATPEITGTAIGVQAMSELPFYFIAAWLLKSIKPNRVVLIAIFGTALRLFLYSVNNNPGNVIFIETLNGITWTLLWIASVEFVNEIVPPEWRTTGQSLLWAAYFGAGAIFGNVIIGRMYENMEMQKIYSIFSVLILGIAILSALNLLLKQKPKLENR